MASGWNPQVWLQCILGVVSGWCCKEVFGTSLSEPHTYRTAVQNPPYIYIRMLVRPSGVQFGPTMGPFKRATHKRQTASNDSKVNNIALKTATLVSRFS